MSGVPDWVEETNRARAKERGRKGKVRGQGEHNHQKKYFNRLRERERDYPQLKFIFAVPNSAKRSVKLAAMMKAEGLKAGVPDICIPIPRHGHGAAWIENKFGENQLTDDQEEFSDFLISQGYAFKTCYTVEEAFKFTEWYLGIELGNR